MKKNEILQKKVQEAINAEPLLSVSEIGVTAKNGIVTLTGTVDSMVKKWEAESAAKSVDGVLAVVENIEVHFTNVLRKGNIELARAIVDAFISNEEIPAEKIKIRVENGWVTLEGELKWHSQKEAALLAIKSLNGVLGLSNEMTIKADKQDTIEKNGIEMQLALGFDHDNLNVIVQVIDNRVTLSGTVRNMAQKEKVFEIARSAKGIVSVDNKMVLMEEKMQVK